MAIRSLKTGVFSRSLLVGNAFYNPPISVDYLVVAGGAGGKNYAGGGAGQVTSVSTASLTRSTSYTVTIGAGGALNTNGSNSVFSSTTASLGNKPVSDYVGGTSGNGYAGGTGKAGSSNSDPWLGGGGGGASAVGGNNTSSTQAGVGGAGTASSITGSSVTYGGGGGGGVEGSAGSRGTGGSGGGGNGSGPVGSPAGSAGTANTGGGGGGGDGGNTVNGFAGGSGVIIVRALEAATATTGSPTYTTSGSYHIYKFTGSGSITY